MKPLMAGLCGLVWAWVMLAHSALTPVLFIVIAVFCYEHQQWGLWAAATMWATISAFRHWTPLGLSRAEVQHLQQQQNGR